MEGVEFRPRAERDIEEYYLYLHREAGSDAALRFLQAIELALEGLKEMPNKGRHRHVNRRLAGLRQWPLPGFERVLLFYLSGERGLEILRVLHGARDMRHILRRER